MFVDTRQKKLIERVINVFETGTPAGRYDALTVMADGPHQVRQITYGRSQTTEYGNLRTLVASYVSARSTYSAALAPFLDRIGADALADEADFKSLLVRAGSDPVMQRVQDAFFDRVYFEPARSWAEENGFREALSMLVVYDSFIHSGGILWTIRNRFAESPPAAGGDERAWIEAYVRARRDWLATHSNALLHNTVYRMDTMLTELSKNDWDLSAEPIVAHGVNVTSA